MDINFIQETIDSLRTVTQLNGALTRLNSLLINEVAKESTINTKAEEIKLTVENIDLSSLENKMEEGVNNLSNKIDNIKLPEIDTTELAKEATLNEVSNKIESIINIDNLAADIVAGKEKLASSISYKGVYSSSADSLEDMAIKIRRIPQVSAGNSADSGTEEDSAYYDSDSQFNPYLVAKALNSEQFPSYIPEYMYSYRNRYAPSSFWVGEYSCIGSIFLNGADGYLTSDGHFYSYANTGDYMHVTHTLPDGSVETYDANTIEHVWENNKLKSNRWVAYYFFDSAYAVNTNPTPFCAVLSGKCNSFSYTGSDVMRRIIVIGELHAYTTNITNNLLDANQVIETKSIQNYALHYTTRVQSLSLPKLEAIDSQIVNNSGNNTTIESISIPNAQVISVGDISFNKLQNLKYFSCGAKEILFSLSHAVGQKMFSFFKSIIEVHFPNLKTARGIYSGASLINASGGLKYLYLDSLESVSGVMQLISNDSVGNTEDCITEIIYMPKFKRFEDSIKLSARSKLVNLIDLTVGELETNAEFSYWTATNVLVDPEKTIQLQNNIHNHIAERVKDVTGEAPLTITFSQGVRDVLLPETEALFAAKNWNIAPAKTVTE